MELLSNLKPAFTPKVIFDSGYLKVLDINNYHAVQENDMLVCIPYFPETGNILLRYESIPTYNFIVPQADKFVCIMSETFKDKETPREALKRGLKEEFGIIINDNVNADILTPIFSNKGNTARYHICILPLMSYDYEQVKPEGDGTEYEMTASNISIQINEINNLIIYDLITRYAIDLFKKEYALF